MAVLITGMAGFIGSHLGRRLAAEGQEVVAILRPGTSTERIEDYLSRVRVVEGSLDDPASYRDALREIRPERAIHLAWYAKPGRFWDALENLDCVRMTLVLAKLLSESGCQRLVAVGTCAEYRPGGGPLSEDSTPLEPQSLYGVAKNATRSLLEASASKLGFGVAWGRIFFPFGPGEPEERLVPSLTQALLRGEQARCSHGAQRRDFIHVSDCVSALVAIAQADVIGPVNIGSGKSTSVREVVENLVRLTGRSPEDVSFGAIPSAPDDPEEIVADTAKLRALGWRPRVSLESGLAECVESWRKRA